MPQKPESKIVDAAQVWVEKQGGNALKIYGNAVQRSGEPDLIGGIHIPLRWDNPFVHFAIEFKLPGEDARPLQKYRMQQWAKVNFVTGVAHSLEEFKKLIGWIDDDNGEPLEASTSDS